MDVYPLKYSPAALPSMTRQAPAKKRRLSTTNGSSPRAEVIGLPTSLDSSRASSSACSCRMSASLWSISALSAGVVSNHASNALLAASTALSTSSSAHLGTSAITSLLAGSITRSHSSRTAFTNSPPTKLFMRVTWRSISSPLVGAAADALGVSSDVHQVRVNAPLEHPAGDYQALNLACALPDAVHAELAVVPFCGVLGHVAASPEDLDGPVSHAAGHLRSVELRHRRLPVQDAGVISIPRLGHVVRHKPRRVQFGHGVGQHELDRLILRDLLAGRRPLQRPRARQLYKPLGSPAAARRDHEPLERKPTLGSLVFPA